MVDTLRLLLFWECNLSCNYCCNNIPEVRNNIKPFKITQNCFNGYDNICISGGEPFIRPNTVYSMLSLIPKTKDVYIYSNGILLHKHYFEIIDEHYPHVKGINIGLHNPKTFDKLIHKLSNYSLIRFHVEDIHKESLTFKYPKVNFKFWKMNECEMKNEHIRILK